MMIYCDDWDFEIELFFLSVCYVRRCVWNNLSILFVFMIELIESFLFMVIGGRFLFECLLFGDLVLIEIICD